MMYRGDDSRLEYLLLSLGSLLLLLDRLAGILRRGRRGGIFIHEHGKHVLCHAHGVLATGRLTGGVMGGGPLNIEGVPVRAGGVLWAPDLRQMRCFELVYVPYLLLGGLLAGILLVDLLVIIHGIDFGVEDSGDMCVWDLIDGERDRCLSCKRSAGRRGRKINFYCQERRITGTICLVVVYACCHSPGSRNG